MKKKKKESNYAKNVKKAGIFEDYTEFYTKRGTELNQSWKKDVNLGHVMVKTKFDWSGGKDNKEIDSTNLVNKKKAAAKKTVAAKKVAAKKTTAAKKKAGGKVAAKAAPKKKAFGLF